MLTSNESADLFALASIKRKGSDPPASPVKKARVCFSMEEELTLLQLVLKYNPFADQSRWPKISDLLHASNEDKTHVHTMRSLKDKVRILTKDFKTSGNRIQIRKSGTNEQYLERRALLAGVIQLQEKYISKTPAEYNKASRPKSANEFPQLECIAPARVSPVNDPEFDVVVETKVICPDVHPQPTRPLHDVTSASSASCETVSEQGRESRAESKSTDLEVRKLQIQERTLDLREKELQTVLKQQELLAKQQEILERTTVIFMKFIDKMTNSCERR